MPISYISPRLQATDEYGRPLVGGRLYTYKVGTTTPHPTYQDADGTAANTNPVILDARGEAVLFLDADQRGLGLALRELQQSLRETLQRANPQVSQELSRINQAYAMLTRLQRAAGGAGATEGVFTPAQLSSAVRAGDRSARHGAFARGDALMQDLSDAAKGVMPGTVPDSGTAGRLFLGGLSAWVSPQAAAGLGAASIPYLPGLNRLSAMALGRRPEFAPRIAEAVSKGFVPAPFVAGPLANQVFGQ